MRKELAEASKEFLGPVLLNEHEHPWQFVDLPAQECTCGNWQDTKFPCVHAVCAALWRVALDSLYDSNRLSMAHFRDTYNHPFKPWLINVTLKLDRSLHLPVVTVSPPEKGKRGLKPGPKPKRKKWKGET
uniref:SWIM-type domain-containing protein n=1 Tax=Globisporangium ultimum (strain ATCC 200006 / CBS 805.95 / DAOM BR144) TaxID=431595 RepID=K3X4Y3_GLOUD